MGWGRGLALAFAVAGCAVAALLVGETSLDWREALVAGSMSNDVLWGLRLPRVVLALLVGAALSAAGATLQGVTRNPLADPFILGVSGGAALGATLSLAAGFSGATLLGFSATSAAALVGAAAATALVLFIGRVARGNATHTTLLAGVIFNAFALALVLFVKAFLAPDRLGEVLFWLAGSLGYESPSALAVTAVIVASALAVMGALSFQVNALRLGDDDALALGVNVPKVRAMLVLASSAAVAAAVAVSGLVGFVGLLVPHLARRLWGADHRVLLPTSALLGAGFLVLADAVGRSAFHWLHAELPVGVVTALLGGPAFLFLLVRR